MLEVALLDEVWLQCFPNLRDLFYLVALVDVQQLDYETQKRPRLKTLLVSVAIFQVIQQTLIFQVTKKESLEQIDGHNWFFSKVVLLQILNKLGLIFSIGLELLKPRINSIIQTFEFSLSPLGCRED